MPANIALLLALSLAWGGNYLFIAWADHGLPPVTASAAITAIAAAVLVLCVGPVMRRPLVATLRRKPAAPLIMAVTAVALPQLSVVAAEKAIPPDLSAVIGTTVPILTFLVSALVLRNVPARAVNFLGVAIAVAGIAIFSNLPVLLRQPMELVGVATMMAGGAAFVVNGIYAASRTSDLDQFALTAWIMIFAATGLTVAALLVEGVPAAWPPADSLAGLALSGVVGMGLAYLLYYLLIARAGAAFTSLYAFIVPPLGVLAAAVAGGGALTVWHVAGVAIVVAGLWLVLWRPAGTPGVERRG